MNEKILNLINFIEENKNNGRNKSGKLKKTCLWRDKLRKCPIMRYNNTIKYSYY